MTKIQRETVADRATEALRHRIVTNDLREGTPVKEEAMADELGVSRSTMRQVINSLLAEGLLTRQSTTRVVQVATLGEADVVEIYRARRFLELGGVDAAAEARESTLQRLVDATASLKEAVAANDPGEFARADTRCHQAIVGFLESRLLSETHAVLMSQLSLVFTRLHLDNEDLEDSMAAHEDFTACVIDGRLRDAREKLRLRLDFAEADVLRKVRRQH